jgi:hypothetical protein
LSQLWRDVIQPGLQLIERLRIHERFVERHRRVQDRVVRFQGVNQFFCARTIDLQHGSLGAVRLSIGTQHGMREVG